MAQSAAVSTSTMAARPCRPALTVSPLRVLDSQTKNLYICTSSLRSPSMSLSTTPTQERSRRRREQLLRAATELLAEGGARAVTHRAVAHRAGLPAASTTYYFSSIQQLTDEALAMHVGERVRELAALAEAATAVGGTPTEIAGAFATSLADRADEVVVAQFE